MRWDVLISSFSHFILENFIYTEDVTTTTKGGIDMRSIRILLLTGILSLLFVGLFSGVALAAVSYELYVYSPTPIYTGESTTVNFQIKNLNSIWDGYFAYRLVSQQVSF